MNTTAFQIVRICAVIALVCAAAALATPRGRLPLALRGLAKLLARDRGLSESAGAAGGCAQPVSGGRRALAFFLVLLATLLALI